jgi:hypothetical protein
MWTTVMYAAGASLPLLGGAIVGVRWQPPQRVVATVLAFTGGALIVSTSFELFEPAYEGGGAWRAGLSFGAGALVFVVADTWLDRRTSGSAPAWRCWPGSRSTASRRTRLSESPQQHGQPGAARRRLRQQTVARPSPWPAPQAS